METVEAETGLYRSKTLFAVFALTCIVTTGLIAWYAPTDWSYFRILAGGVSTGALAFLSVFVNHLLIPTWDDEETTPAATDSVTS